MQSSFKPSGPVPRRVKKKPGRQPKVDRQRVAGDIQRMPRLACRGNAEALQAAAFQEPQDGFGPAQEAAPYFPTQR